MRTRDRTLFLATAANNKLNVALHTIAGVVLIGSSVGFSAMIALYFGFDVLGLKKHPQLSVFANNKTLAISAAIIFALAALISRIGQTFIEAKVTVDHERWFAETLRLAPAAKRVKGSIPRASNYYGRLAATSMRAVSIVGVLLANLIGLLLHLPRHYGPIGIALILCCFGGLYAIMRIFNVRMADSTSGMFKYTKSVNDWKLNSSHPSTEELNHYFKAYLNRIFIASYFSFTPLFFALGFAIFIFMMHELDVTTFDLGEIFIVFTLLRAYLALVGNFFGALLQAAALLPAVRPYAAFIPGLNLSQEQLSSIEAKYLVDDPLLESQSLDDY